MDPAMIARQTAFILAAHARVRGMMAENQHRLSVGQSIAYGEEAFNIEAAHMENLGQSLI